MSDKIVIRYDAVYTKTAEYRARIDAELHEIEACYRHIQEDLHGMDGATNSAYFALMQENKRKIAETAENLHKLLAFIDASAMQMEANEMRIKSVFDSSDISASNLTTELQ